MGEYIDQPRYTPRKIIEHVHSLFVKKRGGLIATGNVQAFGHVLAQLLAVERLQVPTHRNPLRQLSEIGPREQAT